MIVLRWIKWLWQQMKHHRLFVIGIIVVLIAFALAVLRFGWDWTGFSDFTSPSARFQRGKTLWDWLQLLIIPAVLAIGGYVFNFTVSRNERQATEQRAKSERDAAEKRDQTEREIATDNQQEAALQDYIDKMSELLLDRKLRESAEDDETRKIARVRTLTVLPRLDPNRKGSVLQFLYESHLASIIDLSGADLSEADLKDANLSEMNLSKANLREAILTGANLRNTNLSEADLRVVRLGGADLSEADLYKANLYGAYLLPLEVISHGSDALRQPGVAIIMITNMSGANLREASLRSIFAPYAQFERADLSEADMSYSMLENSVFREATLDGVDLSEANLRNANLCKAILQNAKLNMADLSGATLHEAKVTTEQLNNTKSLQGATMPDGSTHP